MTNRLLVAGGKLAAVARKAGLGGAWAGIRNVFDALWIRLGVPPLRAEWQGIRLAGYLRHRSFLDGLTSQRYESFELNLFRAAAREADTLVDIGAHIGLFTVAAIQAAQPAAVLRSFEPDIYNVRALRYNIRKARGDSVRLTQKAVSNAAGRTRMWISEGTIGSSLLPKKNIGPAAERMVETTTLDAEMDGRVCASLVIKMDVEGAECLALEGMSGTLARAGRCLLLCEVNVPAMEHSGRSPADLTRLIRNLGFDLWTISEGEGCLRPPPAVFEGKTNVCCAKNWALGPEMFRSNGADTRA